MKIVRLVRKAVQAARLVDGLCKVAPEAGEALESGARLMQEAVRSAPNGLTQGERAALAEAARRFGEELAQAVEAAPVAGDGK